jgi:hypothetical protein
MYDSCSGEYRLSLWRMALVSSTEFISSRDLGGALHIYNLQHNPNPSCLFT